jgi:hypothetical protein
VESSLLPSDALLAMLSPIITINFVYYIICIEFPTKKYMTYKPYRLGHLLYFNSEIISENMKLLEIGDIPPTGNQCTARQNHVSMEESRTDSTPLVGFNPTIPARV